MDTRNLRSTQYINPCKVGGEIRKTCFIKMRQLELINFSRLRTFTDDRMENYGAYISFISK